jgi:hypothetical protein
LLVWGVADGLGRLPRPFLFGGAVVVLSLAAAATRYQLSHWQNSEMLYHHGLRIAPKVLLPGRGLKDRQKDTLRQKSGYRGRNG